MENMDQFKERGIVKFNQLFSLPSNDRIPGLIEKYSKIKIHALIVKILTDFQNSFNLIRPMSEEQIVSCAFAIMESAHEDNLGMEDLVIFFEGAKMAKYGRILDRLDQQTIFELMEQYREARHGEYLRINQEKQSYFKSLGPMDRGIDYIKEEEENLHKIQLERFKKNNTQ